MPLTLGRLEPDTEVCILELAMRGFGQIAELCEIARPDIGVITTVGPVHLELVGSVDGVARAKAELVAALPPGGIAVVPESSALDPHLRDDIEIRRVGPVDVELRDDGAHVAFGGGRIRFPLTSRHQAQNALTALTAYDALGLPLDLLAESAAECGSRRWRGEELALPGGGFVINDAYNANPTSMEAALRHLAERGAGRAGVAILGGMAELGEHAERHHREIAELAAELGIEVDRGRRPRAGLRCRDVGAGCRRRARDGPTTSFGPETPCSSRPRAPSRSKASPPTWRTSRLMVPSLHSGPDRDGDLGRDRPEVHRVPAPERVRPADPRGRSRRPRGQAGNAGDGRPADPALRAAAVPRALPVHAAGADRALHDASAAARSASSTTSSSSATAARSGLQGRWKLLLLAAVTVVVGFAVHAQSHLDTSIYVPVANVDIPLSYAYYPFLFLIIAGAANGANLTDGLDGLAAGTGIIALLTFLAITVIGYIRSGDPVGALASSSSTWRSSRPL